MKQHFELDKAYNPAKYEAKLYQQWEESGAFKPNPDATKEPFTIIMPPLNANGDMHAGHGMYVVEDITARYRRMQGHATLWLPGTDHAAIETQVVYERLLAMQGQSRFDLGREEFSRQVLEFTHKNSPNIISQFKSAGYSADWSRLKFTLDPDIVEIVYATFKQMHADGHIYRGNRIVNWCTNCRSSFADIEVKFVEREDALYTLDYGPVRIATTRPETIFADAAVAVNPKDDVNGELVGETALIPLIDRPIPIIADEHVDLHFGTGALKVTPAHDKNDYEIGLRHRLPEISIIDLDGRMINVPEEYAGLTVAEARQAVLAALDQTGKLLETKPLTHSVGYHDRCGTVIEPLITEQWYLRMAELNAPVIKAFETNQITVYPARFKKIAIDWLNNEHDWNISRQNWFGIRMPIFYKESNDPNKDPYLITADEAEAKAYYGEGNYRAETDVFDTWFSSGQWAYATLMATGDFDRGFFPTSAMMSGRDILTKWITRMTMFSLYRTRQVPFKDVYLWGLVNDAHGKKMSKSKGNVLNPLEVTAKYGTDALRLALTIGITPGNDGSLSEPKIEGYRNFCNKLWNVARFILGQLPEAYSPATPELHSPTDRWIMAKLATTITEVTRALEDYRFGDAGQTLYSLLWDDFADWYVEASKISPNHDLLIYGLETILKLLHPIAPFVTEAIWSELPWQSSQLIITSWPSANKGRTNGTEFEAVRQTVLAARALAAEEQLSKPAILTTDKTLFASAELIQRLARAGEVRLVKQGSGLYLGGEAWIEAGDELIKARQHRLQQQRAEKTGYLKSLQAKLANERFVASAPAAVVQETRDRQAETEALLERIEAQLQSLR
ncbi:MAG TPA: valine--tRNA ligase [Candidatus Saccharimonadia bacterium]|nr:valine--tRNA ligase [Candidatus Saccharimonadia bacterium]